MIGWFDEHQLATSVPEFCKQRYKYAHTTAIHKPDIREIDGTQKNFTILKPIHFVDHLLRILPNYKVALQPHK